MAWAAGRAILAATAGRIGPPRRDRLFHSGDSDPDVAVHKDTSYAAGSAGAHLVTAVVRGATFSASVLALRCRSVGLSRT